MPFANSDPKLRASISLVIAFALHILIFAAIRLWLPTPIDPLRKTIPIQLVSHESIASARSQAQQQQSDAAKSGGSDVVTTESASSFRTATNQERRENSAEQEQQQRTQRETNNRIMPDIHSPVLSQESRVQRTGDSLRELFAKRKKETTDKVDTISTKEAAVLSDYELVLIERLSSYNQLYDDYHDAIRQAGKTQFHYVIEIGVFANGAVRKAEIVESSGIKAIDALAVRTIYNASPLPPPPKEDFERGFNYLIPFGYEITRQD